MIRFCEALPLFMNRKSELEQKITHETTDQLPRSQRREVLLFLFLRSELVDWVHNKRGLNGSCRPIPRIHPIPLDQKTGTAPLLELMSTHRSISLAIKPYATLLTPAQPYP